MDIQLLKDSKAGNRIVALILLVFGIGIILSLLGLLLSALLVEGSVMENLQNMSSMNTESDVNLMKYFQIVSQISFFIVPAMAFGFLIQKNIGRFYHTDKFPKLLLITLGIVIIFISNPFSEWLVVQNSKMSLPTFLAGVENWMREAEAQAAIVTNKFLEMDSFSDFAINILMIGVLAAIGEELLLRGAFQPLFIRIFRNVHIGIWVTAFFFSFMHFQFYGFFARMFLGGLLGYFFYYTNNLWVPIVAHFFNNAAAVSYVYITKTPLFDTSNNMMVESETNGLYALVSFSLVILGVFLLRFYSKRKGIEPMFDE